MTKENSSIGGILKNAREEQGLSLDDISTSTRIKVKYLAAIESNNFDALPSPVQKKGFVRSYARALDLDPSPLISRIRMIVDESPEEDVQTTTAGLPESDRQVDDQPMGEIGKVLRTQREHLGFNLNNIEKQIFIPERYLSAIENGNLDELPSTVQGRGMVKNYAQFLGLDPEPLLLGYADALQSRLSKAQEEDSGINEVFIPKIWFRRFLANPTIFSVAVILLIGTVSIWSGILIFGNRSANPENQETIPAVADILLPSETPTATLETPESTPGQGDVETVPPAEVADLPEDDGEPTSTPGITGNEKIQVQLIIIQRTWIRVIVDNIVAFEGRLQPGSVKFFGGELSIEVLTGNAAGVEVIYNQQDLGVMGLFGEVVDRVYTAEGIATPTPTITSTPTSSNTPEPSLTPTPSTTPETE
jgi:cytoskeletal protein RodZ